MAKLKLTEAAADILGASIKNSYSAPFGGDGYKPNVQTPQQSLKDIGRSGHKTTDPNPNATAGVPTATPPGATPPVGSEKWGNNPSHGADGSTYKNEPQMKDGRTDLSHSPEDTDETSDEDKKNRKAAKLPGQTFKPNPGAKSPSVSENEDDEDSEEDEEFEEASLEEVSTDIENLPIKEFQEKYGMSKDDAKLKLEEIAYATSFDQKLKEDIDAMLSGENISEEFKGKVAFMFEAAVNARVNEYSKELEEKFTKEFEDTLDTVKEDFSEKLDQYLDYVVSEWMTENKIAVEKGLRTEVTEDFISALKNVFVEHYIDIPDEKVNVVEELVSKVEELENKVNEQMLKNVQLKKSISEQKKVDLIQAVCEGLTLSQAEKIKTVAKTVEFVSEEDFSGKLNTIKESYTGIGNTTIKTQQPDSLNEVSEEDNVAEVITDQRIASYANIITKYNKFQ